MSMMTRRQCSAGSAGMLATGLGRRSGARARAHPPGLSDQHLGHADLLPAQVRPPGEARYQVPGVRGAVRQPHHAADGGAPGGHGNLRRPSFIIGHDKGGLVAIALIEYVGKTAQIVTRKDLNIAKVEELADARSPTRPAPRSVTCSWTWWRATPASARATSRRCA